MAQENVEVVRGIYAEWSRGHFGAALPLFDPEITFETFMPDAAENIVVQGLDQIESFMRDWFEQRPGPGPRGRRPARGRLRGRAGRA